MAQEKQATAPAFTKTQLLASKRYADRRDALTALLAEDRPYTLDEVQKILDGFMKGKVK